MVGGSAACTAAIRSGHEAVGGLLKTASGRAQLAKLFPKRVRSAQWLEAAANQRTFAGCGAAFFPAQSDDPACTKPACNIRRICEIMLAGGGDGNGSSSSSSS